MSTLIQSRVLKLLGVEAGHFSYIFIDEAAQVLTIAAVQSNDNNNIINYYRH